MNLNSYTKILCGLLLSFMASIASATPMVVNFAPGTYSESGGIVDRSYDVSFSSHLYTHPDGFYVTDGVATNGYGERNEYFTFDNEVSLTSIDFGQQGTLSYSKLLYLSLYDGLDKLLDTISFDLKLFSTVAVEQDNVAKVMINFAGSGNDNYKDGRGHSWYKIDNIRYDTDNNLYPTMAEVPEPAPLGLILLALFATAVFSRKSKILNQQSI